MTKQSKIFSAAAAAFAAAISFSSAASATIFNIDYHDAGVWNAYDDENQTYAMKFRSDQGKDGFWLVVTDGDNPKGDSSDFAILYGDLKENRITAYTYDGANNSNSYDSGTFLGTFDNAFSSGGQHARYGYDMTMFSLDVGAINDAFGDMWTGVALGEKAGIWFHQSEGSQFEYGADGNILDYSFASQMWLDRGGDDIGGTFASPDCVTSQSFQFVNSCGSTQLAGGALGVGGTGAGGGSVPAPGGLALVLVGLAGLGGLRRRNKKAA